MPTGLTASSTAITGICSVTGSQSIQIRITDSLGKQGLSPLQTFTIVEPNLNLNLNQIQSLYPSSTTNLKNIPDSSMNWWSNPGVSFTFGDFRLSDGSTTGILYPIIQNGSTTITFSYSSTITPISFSITSGSLPNGLSLNSNTGLISGNATSTGYSTFNIRLIDTNSKTSNFTVNLATCSAIPSGYTPFSYFGISLETANITDNMSGQFATRYYNVNPNITSGFIRYVIVYKNFNGASTVSGTDSGSLTSSGGQIGILWNIGLIGTTCIIKLILIDNNYTAVYMGGTINMTRTS
jgi:hypothetical protein